MEFWEKILNGGLDRDLDGDIDSRDRELYFEEELRQKKLEKEKEEQYRENDSWKNDYLDELLEYDIDVDDYDDEEEFLEALEEIKKAKWNSVSEDDSEYFEMDTDDDYEEVEQNNDGMVTLSFSVVESKRAKPSVGVWKYYDENFGGSWNYDQALIENFPALAQDYEPNISDETLPNIIVETYEIDHDRAVKYLKWLWKTFAPDLFDNEKDSVWERESYKGRALLIYRLISENEDSKELYKLLKGDVEFIYAAFRDCVHKKHQIEVVKEYMLFMIRNNDMSATKLVYNAYLKYQKGRYSDKDLGDLWMEVIYGISWLDSDEREKIDITRQLIPLIEKIGIRGKKPLETIAKLQKEWTLIMNDEEGEEEKIDELIEKGKTCIPIIEDKYVWRTKIAPSKMRYANPYDYETIEEFEKAVSVEFAKYEELQAKKRRKGYLQENICRFCKVDLMETVKDLPYYLIGELNLSVGDEVVVPFGADNKEMKGIVVSIGMCFASIFSFDIKQMKTVIKVVKNNL